MPVVPAKGKVLPKARASASWEVLLDQNFRAVCKLGLSSLNGHKFHTLIAACSRSEHWHHATVFMAWMQSRNLKIDIVMSSAMMKTSSRVQRWQGAASIFRDLWDRGILPDSISFGILLSAHMMEYSWKRSAAILSTMFGANLPANQICLHSAAMSSVASGQWQAALTFLVSPFAGFSRRDQTSFNGLILCCERGGLWTSATWLLSKLAAWRCAPDDFGATSCITACGKRMEWKTAMAILDSPAGVSIDTVMCNAALDAYSRMGKWFWASTLFQKMCSVRSSVVEPDEISSSTLLAACETASLWKPQLDILSLCRNARLPLRVGALNIALRSGLDRGMKWGWSLQMLEDMQMGTSGVDAGSLKSTAQVCAAGRSWQHSIALCSQGRYEDMDVRAFVATTLPESSKWQVGLNVHARSAESVLPAYVWLTAVGLIGSSWRLRLRTKLGCSSAISCCGKAQAWLEALCILRAASVGVRIDIAVLNSAVTAGASGRAWQLGISLWDCMQRIALSKDSFSMTAVLGCLAPVAKWELGLNLRRNFGSESCGPTELSATISCCDAGREWLTALHLLRTAPAADLASFSAAVSACGKQTEWQPAYLLLHGAASVALRSDVLIYDAAMAACAAAESNPACSSAASRSGDRWALGSRLLTLMSDSWIAASVFSATGAMTTFVRDSQWNLGAMFLAEMLQMQAITSTCADQSSRSMLHNAAISACEKAGEWQIGCLLLDKAEINNSSHRIGYHAGISALEKGGQWKRAFQMLHRMQLGSFAADLTGLNAAISSIQRARAWCHAYTALDIASSKALWDEITLSTVISACEKSGRWQQALGLLLRAPSCRAPVGQIMMNAAVSACEKGEMRRSSVDVFAPSNHSEQHRVSSH
eukprot:s1769_g14.t1